MNVNENSSRKGIMKSNFNTKRSGEIFRLIEAAPLMVPAAIAAFGSVAVLFLLFDEFHTLYVWGAGLPAAIIAGALVYKYGYIKRPGTRKAKRVCDVLLIIGVMLWGGFNFFYTSQHVFTNRDPATYAVAGAWLEDHDSLRIDAINPFGDVQGIESSSAGFAKSPENPSVIHAQGLHLLPAFLGLTGRIVGEEGMLHLNVVFGMAAIMAVYALGRLLMRPQWALLSTSAFAMSLPLLYFSRDTYTEPLALVFIFGGLALLWVAQKQQALSLWALAGFVFGASSLARIDAFLAYVGVIAFLGFWVALAYKGERKKTLSQAGAFTAGLVSTSLLGWFDLTLLSRSYYIGHTAEIFLELWAIGAAVLSAAALVIIGWYTNWLSKLDRATSPWRAKAVVWLIVVGALIMASRPLWYVGYRDKGIRLVGGLQRAAGDPVAPQRTYAEMTGDWLAWYLGPVLVAAAIIGMAWVAYKAVKRRDMLLLPILFVVMSVSFVYLNKPSITPDQVWATRRLLPVVMPGIAIFGGIGLQYLYYKFKQSKLRLHSYAVIAVFVLAILSGPLFISQPFLFTRDTARLTTLDSICAALPNENVAVLWLGIARTQSIQPTRTYCDVPSEGYGELFKKDLPDREVLQKAAINARNKGYIPVVGVSTEKVKALDRETQSNLKQVTNHQFYELEQTLTTPPNEIRTRTTKISLGILNTDGTIDPLLQNGETRQSIRE